MSSRRTLLNHQNLYASPRVAMSARRIIGGTTFHHSKEERFEDLPEGSSGFGGWGGGGLNKQLFVHLKRDPFEMN